MAEVAPAANAVEINDALFCQHFKEVVSVLPAASVYEGTQG